MLSSGSASSTSGLKSHSCSTAAQEHNEGGREGISLLQPIEILPLVGLCMVPTLQQETLLGYF